jgi:ubiquinone/menaquinone biosynthesis C-methylase UbiE
MRPNQVEWEKAQEWERNWWLNTPQQYRVEIKKGDIVASWLGIKNSPALSVIDIGCGPFSILQRVQVGFGCAVDPINYGPLELGYTTTGISRVFCRGEDLSDMLPGAAFDEAWIYNCLQHVEDPTAVLGQAIRVAKRVRLFEWINLPPYTGHLHTLTIPMLMAPFREAGWHTDFHFQGVADADGLNGEFYVGVFSRPEQA